MLEFKDISPAGYSQYVEVDLGTAKMLLISGQVPLDEQGNTVGVGDLSKQIEQTFTNLKNIIEKAGGTMSDIAKLNYYLVDMSQILLLRELRNKFINVQNPPASTAVQVERLFREDVLIEIEATVIIPKKK
ncbi:MAG: RidA family protein [Microscillaceae bacterium]|nr:RidA family protein [Microscillaceae bacterium]